MSLRSFLGSKLGPYFPSAPLLPCLWNSFLLRRFPFGFWVLLRRLYFTLLNSNRTIFKEHTAVKGIDGVVAHNKPQTWRISRSRTEKLINILRSIENVKVKDAKMLCVGPRNEAELLLMKLYGFNLKNIQSIDLFSYSPLIQIMDMHQLKFPDNSFDIIYSSYVLRYSSDIQKACDESIRVLKNNGLFAAAFVNGPHPGIAGSEIAGGLQEVLSYFKDHVQYVYWQEEHPINADSKVCTIIFRVKK